MRALVFASLALILSTGHGPTSLCNPSHAVPRANPTFVLKVEPIEMIENGPALVKLRLVYQGFRPIYYSSFYQLLPQEWWIKVTAPASWVVVAEPDRCAICGPDVALELKPGQELTEVVILHQRYACIPKGKCSLTFCWYFSVLAQDASGKCVVPRRAGQTEIVSAVTEVDVVQATSD